jgi:hypothetical protein
MHWNSTIWQLFCKHKFISKIKGLLLKKEDEEGAWHWGLTPLILATWEAEIRRLKI